MQAPRPLRHTKATEAAEGWKKALGLLGRVEVFRAAPDALKEVTYSATTRGWQAGRQWRNSLEMYWRIGEAAGEEDGQKAPLSWEAAMELSQRPAHGDVVALEASVPAGGPASQWRRAFSLLEGLGTPPSGALLRLLAGGEGGGGFWAAACAAAAAMGLAVRRRAERGRTGEQRRRPAILQDRKIPKVIHKVVMVDGMEMPELAVAMEEAVNSFRELNPDYQVRLYSGKDCICYIQKHYDAAILAAFHALKPYAYKCDLFRYLVLFHEGGYYSDMRQVCLRPLDSVFPPDMEWFSPLEWFSKIDAQEVYMNNAFLASVEGHPWLEEAIASVLRSVAQRHYGQSSLDPTGPGLLGRACDLQRRGPKWLLGRLRHEGSLGYICNHKGERFILTKYWKGSGRSFRAGEWGAEDGGGQNYNELWDARDVYCP